MKYIVIEFIGTYAIVLARGLVNIASERQDSSIFGSGLVTGVAIAVFSFFSHGISNGYFNPYFAMSDMFFKVLEVKKALGSLLCVSNRRLHFGQYNWISLRDGAPRDVFALRQLP